MKKSKPLGLIAAREVSTELAGIARFQEQLGPVKAASVRVASRIANRLKAGHPVADYKSLETCRVIYISVPAGQLRSAVEALLSSGLRLRGKLLVIFGSAADAQLLDSLRKRGASVATLETGNSVWVHSGPRRFKRMLQPDARKLVEVAETNRVHFRAAMAACDAQLPPLAALVFARLRDAGLSARQSRDLLERELIRAARAAGKPRARAPSAEPRP